MNGKEGGGVVIAVLGFVALTLAFKGTWSNVWDALLGHKAGTSAATQPTGVTGPQTGGSSPTGSPGAGPRPAAPAGAQGPVGATGKVTG